nr:MAG TPA: hypothetical protein [Caudoviricetes sp.]
MEVPPKKCHKNSLSAIDNAIIRHYNDYSKCH